MITITRTRKTAIAIQTIAAVESIRSESFFWAHQIVFVAIVCGKCGKRMGGANLRIARRSREEGLDLVWVCDLSSVNRIVTVYVL